MRTVTALLLTLLATTSAWAQGAPPIRVGFASAMSGPSAITGEGVTWGGTMIVDEINARGGIMGRKVEAFFADNKGTPGEAVSAVRKLVDVDRVDVIIGQTHSGACLGALPIIKELQMEQNAKMALAISHRGLVLELGRNRFEGTGQELLDDPDVRHHYLGS